MIGPNTELDFYSAISMKQQSSGRHVAELGRIILIPSLWSYSSNGNAYFAFYVAISSITAKSFIGFDCIYE